MHAALSCTHLAATTRGEARLRRLHHPRLTNRAGNGVRLGNDLVMVDDPNTEVERLAREVAHAHSARWLSIIFAPEDPQLPWSVSIDEGRGDDATTAHAATLVEALNMRLRS
jgi:hypothetical protein